MSITNSIVKLKKIDSEIKRRAKDLKLLRQEKKKLEKSILDFLNNNNQNGVKYRNEIAIIKETKKKCNRKYQNPKQRHSAATEILKQLGIDNSSEIATNIINAMKGPKEDSEVIKIQNIK